MQEIRIECDVKHCSNEATNFFNIYMRRIKRMSSYSTQPEEIDKIWCRCYKHCTFISLYPKRISKEEAITALVIDENGSHDK